MFFCDPFGHTDSDHLFNLGSDDLIETDYVFLHDQEPSSFRFTQTVV
jgi:hypothetical protein